MSTIVFSHDTALQAIRSCRAWRGSLTWPCVPLEEQWQALLASNPMHGDIDERQLRALGIIGDEPEGSTNKIHFLYSGTMNRRHWGGSVPHLYSRSLPEGSLMRIAPNIYACCPELCFIQMADVLGKPKVYPIGFELMGLYSLARDTPSGITGVEEPAMTGKSLASYLRKLSGIHGVRTATTALPHLIERSRSPMETALALMLSLPCVQGGFGLERPQLNLTIELNKMAQEACGRDHVECDLYFHAARVDLEYDSVYHNNEHQRRLDTEREAALACMGIQVVRVSIAQLADLDKLEAVARLIANRGRRWYRVRTTKYHIRQAVLHGALLESLENKNWNA